MKNFGKSRLRKGISIVAAMVLLLNTVLPTVPVFAADPLEADYTISDSDFSGGSYSVNPGSHSVIVKDQAESYEEYVRKNTEELAFNVNWKIVDHRNFQGSNDPWLAQYYQINSPAEDGDGTGWDATHPVDPTKFPWLVINYNGFDGDKAIRVLYSGELNDFYWKPSAKVGDNEDRTYGIISVPDDEDLGMHEFVESREGTKNFVDTSKMDVRIGTHQKKTDWESSLSTHTVKFQDSSESVNLTFEKVDGKIVLKKPGNVIKEEYVCNGWETGGYTFGEPITNDITLVANCTPAAVEYTATNGNVTYYDSIPSAFSSNGTYKLLKDVTRTTRMTPGTFASNVILDLNGYTLTSTASDYAILVGRNGSASSHKTFDIVDTSTNKGGKIIYTTAHATNNGLISVSGKYNDVTIGEGVTLQGGGISVFGDNNKLDVYGTVNGGDDFAVAVNGANTINAIINIHEGAVLTSNETAVYLPGKDNLTAVIDGKVTGKTAVEIRAGTLTIGENAELTATGEFSEAENGDGTTVNGAALAVSQHTTNLPIDVTINGGKFVGSKAVYEEDLQDETTEDVMLSIITGEFNGDINSENITGFIDGGIFSAEPDIEYIVEGKVAVEDGAGKYVIQAKTYTVTVNPSEYGTVSVDKASAAQGENVTLTIAPADGYELETLTVGETSVNLADVTNNEYVFTMPAGAVTVSATFKAITYAVNVTETTNGTVTATVGGNEINEAIAGTEITLTVTPDEGYELDAITVTGADFNHVPETDEYTLIMPAGDITVGATFTKKSYTITWNYKDENGENVTHTGKVSHGVVPTHPDPVEYTNTTDHRVYTFSGWTPELTGATQDTEYTAVYTGNCDTVNHYYNISGTCVNAHPVDWLRENPDEKQGRTIVVSGSSPVPPESFTQDPNAYSYESGHTIYTFTGWRANPNPSQSHGGNPVELSEEVIDARNIHYFYWAKYEPTGCADGYHFNGSGECVNTYTVTWKNGDTVLETDANVEYGAHPSFGQLEPTKEADAQYTYTFDGWTKNDGTDVITTDQLAEQIVEGDVVYNAHFSTTTNTYTVTWKNGDTVLETDANVEYGAHPSFGQSEPTKEADAQYTYTFDGWTKNDGTDVITTDQLAEQTVEGDVVYNAHFSTTTNTYTVTWNIDGVTSEEQLGWHAQPSHEAPTKGADDEYTYTFAGWNNGTTTYGVDETLPVVSGEVTYTAVFDKTPVPLIGSYLTSTAGNESGDSVNMNSVEIVNDVDSGAVSTGATDKIILVQSSDPAVTDERSELGLENALNGAIEDTSKVADVQGLVDLEFIKLETDGDRIPLGPVTFDKPIKVKIKVKKSGQVRIKVKHGNGKYGYDLLTLNGSADCSNLSGDEYTGSFMTATAGSYVEIYTCGASTFVAYTEETASASTPSSSTSGGGGGGGGSSSYSCKNLPANAVANNKTTPKKNTDYSYSTDTGAVCTFQCKAGYTRNEKDEKCEKSSEAPVGTDKEGTEKVDTTDTSDTAFEDLRKVLDDGYNVEFHNAYNFAFKNGITTMPNIQAADMNSPLTRIAMAKMLSQYAINVLKKTPDTTKTISFPDVSAELDAEYNNGVTLAYQLGIMGVNIENFRPDDLVTRAEFVTALSRMLFGLADGENLYYETHMQKLLDENIITVDNPNMHELRGYVMIMLMRSVKNN